MPRKECPDASVSRPSRPQALSATPHTIIKAREGSISTKVTTIRKDLLQSKSQILLLHRAFAFIHIHGYHRTICKSHRIATKDNLLRPAQYAPECISKTSKEYCICIMHRNKTSSHLLPLRRDLLGGSSSDSPITGSSELSVSNRFLFVGGRPILSSLEV